MALPLAPRERETVPGDIAESGAGLLPAVRDILSLVAHRHAALWATWHPWLASLGFALPASFPSWDSRCTSASRS